MKEQYYFDVHVRPINENSVYIHGRWEVPNKEGVHSGYLGQSFGEVLARICNELIDVENETILIKSTPVRKPSLIGGLFEKVLGGANPIGEVSDSEVERLTSNLKSMRKNLNFVSA